MRESGDGRDAVSIWSDAPAAPAYAVGDTVLSGTVRGAIVSVDAAAGTVSVEWDEGKDKYGAIVYPADAMYLRKGMPWE